MPLLLRKIRKARWNGVNSPSGVKLSADALGDLTTSGNELSVYHVEDDSSNLERVIVALAANSEVFSNFDYALFSYEVPSTIGIALKQTEGKTPDSVVNEKWHIDLTVATAETLLALGVGIYASARKERILVKEVTQKIAKAIQDGNVQVVNLKGKLRVHFESGASGG